MLVGNKRDLEADREVKREEAQDLVDKWPNCVFTETMAKEHEEICQVFSSCLEVVDKLDERKKENINKLKKEATEKKKRRGKCVVM